MAEKASKQESPGATTTMYRLLQPMWCTLQGHDLPEADGTPWRMPNVLPVPPGISASRDQRATRTLRLVPCA
jgi:hypothetical protein